MRGIFGGCFLGLPGCVPFCRIRSVHTGGRRAQKALSKRVIDVVLSALILLVSSPLLALIALAIKLDSPGPVLFKQVRIGRHRRHFRLYKFRSMRVSIGSAPKSWQGIEDFKRFVFSPPGRDPRVTKVGQLLRASSLDELPQLLNVLRGEMSLVGPRPELPEIVDQYPAEYHRRHEVLPGITGLAQTKGRSDLTYHQVILYDLDYVSNHSIWRDLGILAGTVRVVVSGKGAR